MQFIMINMKIIIKILQGRAQIELYDKASTSFVLSKVKYLYLGIEKNVSILIIYIAVYTKLKHLKIY